MIHCGDNLEIMRSMESESVDLIATDPPFNTGRDFGDFSDRWDSDESYLNFMRLRIIEFYRLLKTTGSLFLHCNPTMSHYLKVEIDRVFGCAQFRNEIVWRSAQGKGSATKKFQNNAERILFYSKSKDNYFERQYRPLKQSSIDRYNGRDGDGRVWRDNRLEMTDPNPTPSLVYEFQGRWPSTRWIWKKERMQKAWDDGLIIETKNGKLRHKKYFEGNNGCLLDDVWDDIYPLNSCAEERVHYGTQKPTAVYERIVSASSPEGGVVFDPFCGSGTTLVAAKNLGRRYIGIDVNPESSKIAERRLSETLV